jgi:hypothetical protein
MEGLAAIVRASQNRRTVRRGEDPALTARIVFFVFSGYIRLWIAGPSLHPFAGLTELKRLLQLLIHGLAPESRKV